MTQIQNRAQQDAAEIIAEINRLHPGCVIDMDALVTTMIEAYGPEYAAHFLRERHRHLHVKGGDSDAV